MKQILKLKKSRGQTALEYALVVAAISLVIMVAWNAVGQKVSDEIQTTILNRVSDQLEKGNSGVRR